MTGHDKQLLADRFADGRDRLLAMVQGLTAEQWSFHPQEGRWSIAECVEHVVHVENRIVGMIRKKLGEAPEPAKSPEATAETDRLLRSRVADRSSKREAPDAVRPSGKWAEAPALVAEFEKARAHTTEFVSGIGPELRNHFLPHPAFGEIDCYQWLLALGLHGDRHAQQIEEIRSDPAFPRASAAVV